MKKYPGLREADEPTPWERTRLPELGRIMGPQADKLLRLLFKREPNFGIIRCDGCGRWQEFPPPITFDAIRKSAVEAGWRMHGGADAVNDLCPICVGN